MTEEQLVTELEATLLGSFSLYRFCQSEHLFYGKPVIALIEKQIDLVDRSKRGEPVEDELDQYYSDFFRKLSDKEQRDFVLLWATSWHERHHFYEYLLTPQGRVLFELALTEIASGMQSIIRPLEHLSSVPSEVRTRASLFTEFIYLSDPLRGELGANFEDVPFLREFNFVYGPDKHSLRGKYPVLYIDSTVRPMGATSILESWTWALCKEFVHRAFPGHLSTWYSSLKAGSQFWAYNLIDSALYQIFGECHTALNPSEKYQLISALSIDSLTVDPFVMTADPEYFTEQKNHPGWRLAKNLSFLWHIRQHLLEEGKLDIPTMISRMKRFTANSSPNLPDIYASLVQEITQAKKLRVKHHAKINIFEFVRQFYLEQHARVLELYLQNPSTACDAFEWHWLGLARLIPHPPMALFQSPDLDGWYQLSFQCGEDDIDTWACWYLYSSLYLSIFYQGRFECPIFQAKIRLNCDRSDSCGSFEAVLRSRNQCPLRSTLVMARMSRPGHLELQKRPKGN